MKPSVSSGLNRRAFLASVAGAVAAAAPPRPNVLLILADDLGFSDLGCFGGEVRTPNLDALAKGGVRFTQFYNSARCCPSRASLLTGLYPHQAGIGNMTGRMGDLEGYQGRLNNKCATIPEVLKQAGYTTLMSGKWHLNKPGPIERGFDEFYGMLHGFDSFWDERKYTRLPAGRPQRSYGDGKFYATDAITDHALDLLRKAPDEEHPWFLYLAYNAPHFPLHAPKKLIDKYQKIYEQGWDRIRQSRYARMQKMGLIDANWKLPPRSVIPPNKVAVEHGWANRANPAWTSIEPDRRLDLARRMATYAAMVEIMDRNIGRVIDHLRANGELDNTLILFLSDNGACAEWDPWGFDRGTGPENILHRGAALETMGQPGTYHSYGSGWANASNTPWRLYKHYNHEGGICTPFIAHWPAKIKRAGEIEHQPGHLVDVMTTCVEVADAKYPSAVQPMEGRSLLPLFAGVQTRPRVMCWEHEGNRAIRDGDWKLVGLGPDGPWELYNLREDRTELNNVALQHMDRVQLMARAWDIWAKRTKVLPWPWTPAAPPPVSTATAAKESK